MRGILRSFTGVTNAKKVLADLRRRLGWPTTERWPRPEDIEARRKAAAPTPGDGSTAQPSLVSPRKIRRRRTTRV